MNKPIIVKGTRDYNALQLYKRSYILDTIKHVYQKYGFEPLETPALEELTTLTEKYGQEGEQLIFKILNSGNFLGGVANSVLAQDYRKLLPQIANKGLRYDLTVPLIRYIVTNQHQLIFPFRRYQMQPVWRADRPQKGRYREFYQCDADIVGTTSLICEGEILKMIYEVLVGLKVRDFSIRVNHRGILKGMNALRGNIEEEDTFCMVVDKLAKIGEKKVFKILEEQKFSQIAIEKLKTIFTLQGNNQEKLEILNNYLGNDVRGKQAINDFKQVLSYASYLGLHQEAITIDPTLARGLTYYTGIVIEVSVGNSTIGSIGGGGRYDGLTDIFGLKGVSGVGFSFGINRLYDIMEEQDLFNKGKQYTTQVMVTNMDAASKKLSLQLLSQLRVAAIKSEIYPTYTKLKKQLSYADKKGIPFVIIIDEKCQSPEKYTLKNMEIGKQTLYDWDNLLQFFITYNA